MAQSLNTAESYGDGPVDADDVERALDRLEQADEHGTWEEYARAKKAYYKVLEAFKRYHPFAVIPGVETRPEGESEDDDETDDDDDGPENCDHGVHIDEHCCTCQDCPDEPDDWGEEIHY